MCFASIRTGIMNHLSPLTGALRERGREGGMGAPLLVWDSRMVHCTLALAFMCVCMYVHVHVCKRAVPKLSPVND